jgi:hypothetical protein
MNNVLPGNYFAHLFQITRTYDIMLGTNNSIIDIWPLVGLCSGVSNSTDVKGEPYMSFTINSINQNLAQVTVVTYCWKIVATSSGSSYTAWVPEYHSSIETPISIHVKDLNLSSEIVNIENNIDIFPNPAKNELSILVKSTDFKSVNIEIYDITGRLVDELKTVNKEQFNIDISNLKSGIYYCKFSLNNEFVTKKFIKQ